MMRARKTKDVKKLKILHINASDIGSTGKIVLDISAEALKRGHECVSIFPKKNREPSDKIREYATSLPFEQGLYRRFYYVYGLHYGFAPISTAKILRIIKRENPDLVHLHSINCAMVNIYRLLAFLKRKNIATVITNHAEFFYTGSCPHAFDCEKWKTGCGKCPRLFYASESKLFDRTRTAWRKMKSAISTHPNLSVASVSPWVNSRSSVSPIMQGIPQLTILNGADTRVFCHRLQADARELLGIGEGRVILHVTANFSDSSEDSKGGRYLLELAERLGKDVTVLVIGKHGEIKNLPSNVSLLGPIYDQKTLAAYYSAANLTVLTSSRETFGMAVAESLLCGTPVVAFESGGSESIAIEEYSAFLPFADSEALFGAVRNRWIDFKNDEISKDIASAAKEKYSSEIMAGKYCDLYEKMTGEGK